MIKRAPLKNDPPGKCSRWHVVVYNKETKKRAWHTVRGTKDDAKAFKRNFESAKLNGDYTGPLERKSFEEVGNLFLDDRRANNRRFSTLEEYQTELKLRLLPGGREALRSYRANVVLERLPLLSAQDRRGPTYRAHFGLACGRLARTSGTLGRRGTRLSEPSGHSAQQGERPQASVDTAADASEGSLPRSLLAALDVRQHGPGQR